MTDAVLSLLGTAFSGCALILVAVIETNNRKERKKLDEREDRLEEQRKKVDERAAKREMESKLSMDMMSANLELGYVTSLAVTGGHTNGNVEAAQERALAAKKAYEDFIRETAAHAITKV